MIPRRVALSTAVVFVALALVGGTLRALRYDFGQDEGDTLIPRASAELNSSQLIVNGRVSRNNCAVLLNAGQIPFGKAIVISNDTKDPGADRFSFQLPPAAWRGQRKVQLLAECPEFLLMHRGVVDVPMPPSGPVSARGIVRAIHLWISPNGGHVNGFLELPHHDAQLTATLLNWSLDQLAQQVFRLQINGYGVYNVLRNFRLRIASHKGYDYLILSGDLPAHVARPENGRILVRIEPAEEVFAIDRPNDGNSRLAVTIKGFDVASFPSVKGIPDAFGPDGAVVWYGSAYRLTQVSIGLRSEPLRSLRAIHHFLSATSSDAPISDWVVGILTTNAAALLRLFLVLYLLTVFGLWKSNERYCGVLAAAAAANSLADAAQWLAFALPMSFEHVSFRFDNAGRALLASFLSAAFICAGMLWMKRSGFMQARGSFLSAALAIFVAAFLGCTYNVVSTSHPGALSSDIRTIFSQAAASILAFILLVVAFQPRRAVECFTTEPSAARWLYWTSIGVIAASAALIATQSYERPPTYGPPAFFLVVFAMQTTFYVSTLAVLIPILWHLARPPGAAPMTLVGKVEFAALRILYEYTYKWFPPTLRKTGPRKIGLALTVAVLTILYGYTYMGFPLTLLVAVGTIYWIALRPAEDYKRISALIGKITERDTLVREAEVASDVETAKRTQTKLRSALLSGDLLPDDYDKKSKALQDFIAQNESTLRRAEFSDSTDLAFGLGRVTDVWVNARLFALLALPFGTALTLLGSQSIIDYVSTIAMPFYVAFAQVVSSIGGYVAAGFGFGLAYPYVRGSIGTVKALWILLALVVAVTPYEFLAGTLSEVIAQGLRWLVFFGGLGILMDFLNARHGYRRLSLRNFLQIAGLGNFAAVGAVAATIVTTLITQESRTLLELAIHYAIPAAPGSGK